MNDRLRVALVAAIVACGIAASYAIALAGEPQSVWLWRTVLGLI